jgi:hypothetical protein
MTILPSFSVMVGLDLADLLVEEDLVVLLAVDDRLARLADAVGQSESVSRGQPRAASPSATTSAAGARTTSG